MSAADDLARAQRCEQQIRAIVQDELRIVLDQLTGELRSRAERQPGAQAEDEDHRSVPAEQVDSLYNRSAIQPLGRMRVDPPEDADQDVRRDVVVDPVVPDDVPAHNDSPSLDSGVSSVGERLGPADPPRHGPGHPHYEHHIGAVATAALLQTLGRNPDGAHR